MQEDKNLSGSRIRHHHQLADFIPFPFAGAALFYCALLFCVSSISSFPVTPPFFFFDKVVHFLLFAGLSALVAMGLQQARHQYSPKMLFILPISFSVLYGLSDEVHQLTVPLRDFSAGDIVADALGAGSAAVFFLLVYQWKKVKR